MFQAKIVPNGTPVSAAAFWGGLGPAFLSDITQKDSGWPIYLRSANESAAPSFSASFPEGLGARLSTRGPLFSIDRICQIR